MVAEAEVACHQTAIALDAQFFSSENSVREIEDVVTASRSSLNQARFFNSMPVDLPISDLGIKHRERALDTSIDSVAFQFVPVIRSGSFSDIGPRQNMEDEHIRIDDLSAVLGSLIKFSGPSAFYGIFDGHGGPEAAAYMRKNAMRLFFDDASFPQMSKVDNIFLEAMEKSMQRAFRLADLALADDITVSKSSGTTALAAFIFGRSLVVANAGDCRAVLCRKGEAIDMSQDHRPIYPSERRRVEDLGGYVDDGYLNGVLSVSRALGDWDMKFPSGTPSPLIADPEFRRMVLTEDDEFLIIGCDGIWDVMSSQHAVSLVRRGLRRHDNPEQCARDLVLEALRCNTFDNLTVIIICLSPVDDGSHVSSPPRSRGQRCCSLSAEALCSLRNLLEGGG